MFEETSWISRTQKVIRITNSFWCRDRKKAHKLLQRLIGRCSAFLQHGRLSKESEDKLLPVIKEAEKVWIKWENYV